ncbi:hypothetical protein [Fibrella forsythiae]|uniref:Helix-turn-helix domain-containing protein n=1 Tax=Fibrella forsythiae TaxID=2817061 RepID=A0ABS3JV40_9BACT|nr:hypothetical protein [Fibrella forsythiae]MBO0953251.1 hypothetical protein [Fibrella forsythiae]
MSDLTNIHYQAEIKINFSSWERFNLRFLGNDGVVLFCYLVFKCKDAVEWSHSDKDILEELGIGRTKLDTLTERFKTMGILHTEVGRNAYNNKITTYRIDFNELAKPDNLKEIYRQKTAKGKDVNLELYSEVFKTIAQHQPRQKPRVTGQAVGITTPQVKAFAKELEDLGKRRRDTFNEQQTKAGNHRIFGYLKFSPDNIRALARAIRHFNDNQFIESAFVAYVDVLNAHAVNQPTTHTPSIPHNLRKPINFFLSYDANEEEVGGSEFSSYPVIYSFGNYAGGGEYLM